MASVFTQDLVVGATAGAVSAGSIIWFLLKKQIARLEETYMPRESFNLKSEYFDERMRNLENKINHMSKTLDNLRRENNHQTEKIIDMIMELKGNT